MDEEKRKEKNLGFGFLIVVAIIVVLLVAFATQSTPENGFEPDPTAFRVGETTIQYNNTTGWWVQIPVFYSHDYYLDLKSHDCLTVRFVFEIELANGSRENWTSGPMPLSEVPEGYEGKMIVKLHYIDREPVSVSLKDILCA